jgi:hypothetical protein
MPDPPGAGVRGTAHGPHVPPRHVRLGSQRPQRPAPCTPQHVASGHHAVRRRLRPAHQDAGKVTEVRRPSLPQGRKAVRATGRRTGWRDLRPRVVHQYGDEGRHPLDHRVSVTLERLPVSERVRWFWCGQQLCNDPGYDWRMW